MSVIILLLAIQATLSGGLVRQLPKDGTWTRFEFEVVLEQGDHAQHGKGSIWIGSVGRTEVNGKPCRWIEVVFDMPEGNEKDRTTVKALIPEEEIGADGEPMDHVIRGWIQRRDRKVKKLEAPYDALQNPLLLVLPGPLKKPQELPTTEVVTTRGTLSCPGRKGTAAFPVGADGRLTIHVENRTHARAPFGVVVSRWDLRLVPERFEVHFDVRIGDWGRGAKTNLPANN